jgi:hypothetical protein
VTFVRLALVEPRLLLPLAGVTSLFTFDVVGVVARLTVVAVASCCADPVVVVVSTALTAGADGASAVVLVVESGTVTDDEDFLELPPHAPARITMDAPSASNRIRATDLDR